MDFATALNVSASGLAAERTRVDLAASNLANAESTHGPDGDVYRRRDPVFTAQPFDCSSATRWARRKRWASRSRRLSRTARRASASTAPTTPTPTKRASSRCPTSIRFHEVVNLVSAQGAYDANATAIETLETMASHALDIAR